MPRPVDWAPGGSPVLGVLPFDYCGPLAVPPRVWGPSLAGRIWTALLDASPPSVNRRSLAQGIPACGRLARFFRFCWLHLFLGCFALLAAGSGAAAQIEIVLSEDTGAYVEAVATLRQELGDKVSVVQTTAAVLERGDAAADSALVVAFGTRALKAALAVRGGPILAALVTHQSFDEALREAPRGRERKSVSAVYLDQPPERHFDLVRTMLPGVSRVGVLVSPGEAENVRRLEAVAGVRRLVLATETVAEPREIHAALAKLLASCDAVVATPDPRIFNGGTLHNILLATYREGRPLFGFSPAYARAGALAAVYSTPQHVAQQLAGAVQRFLGGNGLPPPQFPQLFSVKINPTVVRSFKVAIVDEQLVLRRLQALERER